MTFSRVRILLSLVIIIIFARVAFLSIDKPLRAKLSAELGSIVEQLATRPAMVAAECFDGTVSYCIAGQARDGTVVLPDRTDYWSSKLMFEDNGVPFLQSPTGKKYHNIATMAFDLWPRELRSFEEQCRAYEPNEKSSAILAQLEKNFVELEGGAITWQYDYDTQINDVLLKAPWTSAFSQSAVIERLLLANCKTGEARPLDLALRAGRAFGISISKGGVRSEAEDFVWFQEVPLPDRHNPFIFNAHLYAIKTLFLLHQFFPLEGFDRLAERGIQSVRSVLPIIDNGYWNRYDLRPRYGAFNARISGHGVLQHVSLEMGGRLSEIDFRAAGRSPAGNAAWGNFLLDPGGRGAILSTDPLNLQVALPLGREFAWRDALKPVTMKLSYASGQSAINLATLGFRPGPSEYFGLNAATQKVFANGDQEATYELTYSEFSWGQVAPEYLPFQGSTLADIGRRIGDKEFYLRGLRWEEFFRRFQTAPPAEVADKVRWPYDPDARLVEAVWERFHDRIPADIKDEEINKLIAETFADEAMRERARKTLAL